MDKVRQALQAAKNNEQRSLRTHKQYEAERSAKESKELKALWNRWHNAAERQISSAQDTAIVVGVYRRSWLRKRLNLAAKHHDAAAWPLWQEEQNPDSRYLAPIYYLLADGNLAAGTKLSASIIRPGDSGSHHDHFRKVLERSVEELENM